tara:strand:+ start:566 stop:2782 length:2217 start_codon:yes stop_codon:yes gene_type:complete
MATKKTIELEVNTNAEQAKKGIDDLGQSVDNLNQAEKKVQKTNKDLHASFEEVYGEVKPLTAQMGEMEDRLYQMALAGDTASKEFNDLLGEVGKYRKVQMDTDMVVDAAATTMSQKLGGAIQGAASGFALVQGSMALFGTESEELEATLLKVQSAMAITQGLEGLREGAKSFKAMGMAAKTALSGIRKGLIATGIGAAVVALGLIVAYWKDITAFIDAGSSKAKKLNEDYEEGVTLLEAQKKQTDIKLQIMEAEGATAEEIYRVKLKQLDQEIALGKQKVEIAKFEKKNDIERAKRNKKIFDLIITTLLKPLDAIIDAYNYIARKLKWVEMDRISDMISDAVFDINSITNAAQKSVTDAETSLQNLQDQRKLMTVKFNKQQKASAKSSRQTANQRKDDLLAIEREIFDKTFALRKESEQKEIDLAKETFKREKEDFKIRLRDKKINDKQFALLANAAYRKLKKSIKDIDDKFRAEELEAEKLQQQKEIELQDKQFKLLDELNSTQEEKEIANLVESYEAKFELAEGNAELEKALQEALNKDLAKINAKYRKEDVDANKASNDKKKENDLALQNAKFEMANNTLNLISSINELFNAENEEQSKRNFQIDKAVKIAQATSTGIQGAMNAYTTAQKSPITAVMPAYPFIQAGLAGAFAAVNIAKIAKTKFGGGGASEVDTGGGGGAGGGGSMPQPSFNVVGDSGINQLAELQMQPTQAFVVSGDITTAQSLDRNKIQNATI